MGVDCDRFKATLAAATGVVLTLLICAGEPARALTPNEEAALRALCRAGLKANGGIWASERINAAIATSSSLHGVQRGSMDLPWRSQSINSCNSLNALRIKALG